MYFFGNFDMIKLVKEKNTEVANAELKTFVANIDKACSKGLVKKNTCARQKARLKYNLEKEFDSLFKEQ